jgi:hypothetical protein
MHAISFLSLHLGIVRRHYYFGRGHDDGGAMWCSRYSRTKKVFFFSLQVLARVSFFSKTPGMVNKTRTYVLQLPRRAAQWE